MKNVALFIAVFGLIAFIGGKYIALVAAVGFVIGVYVLASELTADLKKFHDRLPDEWQDILEVIELARDTKYFEGGITHDNLANFYDVLDSDKVNFEVRFNERVMEMFEKKYNEELFKYYPVSPHIRGTFHFTKSYDKFPERLPHIVNAILVHKKVNGTLIRIKQKLRPFFKPVFN